jgi:hypothetical protein
MEAADDCRESEVSLRRCYPVGMILRYLHLKVQIHNSNLL